LGGWLLGVNDPDPIGSKIQLEILRERQRHSDDKIRQLEQELAQAYTNIGHKEKELEQVKEERANLNVKLEVLKKDLQHTQDSLTQNSQANAKKRTTAKVQVFFASLIFLLSSILVNIGTSMLTSSAPSPSLGWTILGLAAVSYIVGASITTLLALEGGN
jgi:regulator of replication initiation timing